MIIAAKCAPVESVLRDIKKGGIAAVEIYTNLKYLHNVSETKQICRRFPFRYTVHAPNDSYEPDLLAELVDDIKAEIVVFHDIYWEDEWGYIVKVFEGINTKLCVENTSSIRESLKVMRRFGINHCLDLEHLQMQCAGVFEEVFLNVMRQASCVHLTGYYYGSNLWHTHIHHSPEHSIYLLGLLKGAGYSGIVVSEGRECFQTLIEFKNLNEFAKKWQIEL